MKNKKTAETHPKRSFWNTIANSIFNRGWDTVSAPSNARCEIYSEQAKFAESELRKDNLSRKDRRFWKKQHDKAMKGLADVHYTNCNHFVALVCGIGASLLVVNRLFSKS